MATECPLVKCELSGRVLAGKKGEKGEDGGVWVGVDGCGCLG
jgi:hypothetical protein